MASSASLSSAVATGRTHVELDSGVMTGSADVELKSNSQKTESTKADFEAGMPESRMTIDHKTVSPTAATAGYAFPASSG